jgi:2-C-methyl-D-erythritol 4-phosphate cytidylyltransferase
MNAGIVLAAGRNPAMGAHVDRAFLSLGTKPVLAFAMGALERCPDIDVVVVVVRRERVEAAAAVASMFGCSKVRHVLPGASLRQGSVQAALDALSDEIRIVSILDASRPCVSPELVSDTIRSAKRNGAAAAGARAEDGVKIVLKGQTVSKSCDRSKIWLAMTPQSFKIEILRDGLAAAKAKGITVGDDSEAAGLVSKSVRMVPATVPNIKITSADDLTLAAAYLRL